MDGVIRIEIERLNQMMEEASARGAKLALEAFNANHESDIWLDPAEASKRYNVSKVTLRENRNRGKLKEGIDWEYRRRSENDGVGFYLYNPVSLEERWGRRNKVRKLNKKVG